MNTFLIIVIIAACVLNATAAVLTKYASAYAPFVQFGAVPYVSVPGVGLMALACVCYGLTLLCYAFSLKTLPLGIVYPIMTAGTALLVMLYAACFLSEPLTWPQYAGVALLILGTMLLMYKPAA